MIDDSNVPQDSADPLDVRLRDAYADVPDGGFTKRVLGALPPRRRFDRVRLGLFGVAFAAGLAVLGCHFQALDAALAEARRQVGNHQLASVLAFTPVLLAVGSLFWGLMSVAVDEANG